MRNRLLSCLGVLLSLAVQPVIAQEAPPDAPLIVPLDETGIADWRFINPLTANDLEGRDLEFFNSTGDRTFVVTIAYESEMLGTAFLSSRVERGERLSLPSLVCHVIGGCSPEQREQLTSLEALKGFQELVRRAPLGKSGDCQPSDFFAERSLACLRRPADGCSDVCSTPCVTQQPNPRDLPAPETFNLTCQLEKLFWMAACQVQPEAVRRLATRSSVPDALQTELQEEAQALVAWMFAGQANPNTTFGCSAECALCRRSEFNAFDSAPQNGGDLIGIVDQQAFRTAAAEFEKRHLEVARTALANAANNRAKELTGKLNDFDKRFETRREELAKLIDNSGSEADLLARCAMRELESAARLLASHADASAVPFELPEDVARGRWCFQPGRVGAEWETREQSVGRMRTEVPTAPATAVDLLDCKTDGTKRTCTATAVIPPNQRARFTKELLRHHPEDLIRFRVAYYGDPEVPPNGAGAVARVAGAQPKEDGRSAFGFGLDTTSAYDLPTDFQGHRRHTGASGALSFQYLGVPRLEFSTTLRFKSGDFGGPDASNQLSATQYQGKISFANGMTAQAGRFRFAQPSAGIAISESGEGIRGGYSWKYGSVTAAYLVRRESDTADFAPDEHDDDSDVYIVQYNPLIKRVRNVLTTLLIGQERNDRITSVTGTDGIRTDTVPRPYTYATGGVDVRFSLGRGVFTTALYGSVRNMRPHAGIVAERGDCEKPFNEGGDQCIKEVFGNPTVDGRGLAGLLTYTIGGTTARKITDPPAKSASAYAVTFWLGTGTGNDPDTTDRDEGYLGETAGYANDVIFLSQISKSKLYADKIGRGLSNKVYVGAQYSDSRISPLEWIARLFELKVESRSTAVSLHTYRFKKPVNDEKYAGSELDLEFKTEIPKGVNWILRTAVYRPGRAVERLAQTPLLNDPWSVTLGVSVNVDAK